MRLKREKRNAYFTQIPNDTLRERKLHDGPHRLLTFMLSYSDDWEFYNEWLSKETGLTVRTIQNYISELETFGYITRKSIRDSKGKFIEWERIIHETPHEK